MASRTADTVALRKIADSFVGDLAPRGYSWVRREMIPLLRRCLRRRISADSRFDLACAYYLLGDIWDIHSAHRSALRAYRQAIQLARRFAAAWREAGCSAAALGRHRLAISCLQRATELDIKDDFARSDLEAAEERAATYILPGKNSQRAAELLPIGRAKQSLQLLTRATHPHSRMWKVCSLGAAGASEREILGSMRGSLATQTGLEIDQHFWFYLPRALLESCEFWRFIKANFGRFHKFELPTKVNSHEALFNL